MSTAIRELPDVGTLIVKHLQADQDLVSAGLRMVAGPESPKQPKWPMVYIHRSGGIAELPFWLDGGRYQIDVWADRDTAKLQRIASKVFVSLQKMVGVHDEGVVTAVQETTGRTFFRGSDTERPRVNFEIRVVAHPNA